MRTFGNLLAFSPELWLLVGAIVVFLVARLRPGASTTMVALVTLVAAFLALATQFKQTIAILDGAFLLDGFAIVIDVIVLAAALLTLLASRADILPGDGQAEAAPGFLLLATLGAMLAASAAEMVSLFLALVFGLTGETRLGATGVAMAALGPNHPAVLLSLSLILGGFALRMGLLPVRWWPRGFESGVPLRVIMFVQSVGVVVAFAAFARLAASTFAGSRVPYAAVFAGIAAIAMTAGNLLAVMQAGVRRLLVYAAIAQAGFALAAFTDLKGLGLSALLVFLVSLALGNICAFATVIAYARFVHSDAIRDLAGMSRAAPGLALALAVAVVSLIGLPPVAGFFGKVLVLQAVVNGGYAWLAVVGAVNIAVAAFGYLRLLKIAFVDPPVFEVAPARLDRGIQVAVALASVGVVSMGLLLGPLYAAASYGRAALLH